MSKIKKLARFITDEQYRFKVCLDRGYFDSMEDEKFLRLLFRKKMGKELDLENPRTMCEKLQWLKLYNRRPEYTNMVDKYEVKKYVAELVGEEHVIPTIGVWDSAEEIDFDSLPEQFVLKCTHDSGSIVICRDRAAFDEAEARRSLAKSLKGDYFHRVREWPYKNVRRRIIAEPFYDWLGKPESIEYKVTCFDGKVGFVTICTGIAHAAYELRTNDHFTTDFQRMDWYVNYKSCGRELEKPELWEELIEFSEKLSQGVPYLRVDSYIRDGRILFGELTFFTWGGIMKFEPPEWDEKLGAMIKLPEEKTV